MQTPWPCYLLARESQCNGDEEKENTTSVGAAACYSWREHDIRPREPSMASMSQQERIMVCPEGLIAVAIGG